MRVACIVVVALALLAVPASAAQIDPAELVLRQADVPAGFELDRDESGVRSNAEEAAGDRRLLELFRRWGRVMGYEAEYDRGTAEINSRADVLKRPSGARMLLDWFDLEARKAGVKGLERARVRIGAEGWIYSGGLPASFTLVAWRHDRVFGGVAGMGISKARTLALARVQQRRIATALR